MAIFKSEEKLFCFVHIPKCGGSSIEQYLEGRFGCIGFLDNKFSALPKAQRWSRTSAQHIDWSSLQRLLPAEFFDGVFTVVRHPVARVVSAYHFQVDIEKNVPREVAFSDWLRDQARAFEQDPFILDNHFRPQADFIPAECGIFHLEHGLDAVVPYIDALVGNQQGPRFVSHVNQRAGGKPAANVMPTAADLTVIAQLYAVDFARFGYAVDRKLPAAPKPDLDADFLVVSAAEKARMNRPLNRIATRVRRKIGL